METFYKAFITPQVNICGFSLNDFSYNHLLILRAIDSPFVSNDPNRFANGSDLITALKVCSSKYPEKSFNFKRRDYVKAYILNLCTNRLYLECSNFSKYINEHQQIPQFWDFESKSGGWSMASSPDELSTITLLIKNNIDHDKAWNMSVGYVNWLSATFLEQAGNPRVFADDQEDDSIIDLNSQPESEIEKIAFEQLGPEKAKQWLKARKHKAGA